MFFCDTSVFHDLCPRGDSGGAQDRRPGRASGPRPLRRRPAEGRRHHLSRVRVRAGYDLSRATVLLTLAVMGCEAGQSAAGGWDTWITEADFQIGDVLEGTALFSSVGDIRVKADGPRIYVLEPSIARISVWSPEGSLLLDLERPGEGPGHFTQPNQLGLLDEGFFVRDARRFTFFADDGTLLGTVPFPPSILSFRGFRLAPEALLEGGGFLARPLVPMSVQLGWRGDDPLDHLPILGLSQSEGRWTMDTVAVLDQRNKSLSIRPSGYGFTWEYHGGQPYEDADHVYFDTDVGNVVVGRKNMAGAEVRLMEITPDGDTVWRRRLHFPRISVRQGKVSEFVEEVAQYLAGQTTASDSPLSYREARKLVEDALYVPDLYPGFDFLRGMSTGDVWLKTFEEVDTLDVWYAVKRYGEESAPRRVLLPHGFYARDATDTHVWGVQSDTLGVNYVLGRRLIKTSSARRE